MPDSTVGIRWRAGAHYRQQHEGFSEGVINSQGWRDSEHAREKPPGTTRILFLGDSFVQAIEVPLDSAFSRRLERDLDRRAPRGHHVEVVAMGRAGMGTTEELLTCDRWGRQYDPDVVALLFIDNDWSDNWKWPGSDELRPYLVPDGDSLRLDDGGHPAYGHWNSRGHALAARLMADWFSTHAPLASADSADVSPRRAGSARIERGGP